jgi:hypothetical protein
VEYHKILARRQGLFEPFLKEKQEEEKKTRDLQRTISQNERGTI